MAHLSEVGPLAVAVDASNWHNYEVPLIKHV